MVNCNLNANFHYKFAPTPCKYSIFIQNSKQAWIGAEQQIGDEQAAPWNLADARGGAGGPGAGEGAEEQGGQVEEGLERGTGGAEARVGGQLGHDQRAAGTQVNKKKC